MRIARPGLLRATLVIFTLVLACMGLSTRSFAQSVYVATNRTTGNSVIQFARGSDGSLTQLREVATGGLGGTGNGVGNLDPLGSQDSLVLSGDGTVVLVVNAGSDQVSAMNTSGGVLQLVNTVNSGGTFPNSVALSGDLVYVLNALGTPNITGFRLTSTGALAQIPGSARPLPGGSAAGAHDVRFSPDGTRLLVTEGGTNQFDIFEVDSSGLATLAGTSPSAGSGPFGFKFGRGSTLVNAEAASASASSYLLTAANTLTVISAAVANGQAASCWISLTGNGKFGFVSNTGSGTISTYHVSGNGTLDLENAATVSIAGAAPIDSALSSDSSFFYVVDSALGRILSFSVRGADLIPIGSVSGLPTTVQGIAAR